MAKIKSLDKNNLPTTLIFLFFIIACLIVGIFCFKYYGQLQTAIRSESTGYLKEVSSRIGKNIDRVTSSNFTILSTISSMFKNFDVDSFEEARPFIETPKEHWAYQEIILIDSNGIAYDCNGNVVQMNNDTYFYKAVVEKVPDISTTQLLNNKETIMFMSPMEERLIDGKSIVAIASTYDPSSFDQILSMTSFNEQAYSCIITKTGTIAVRSTSQALIKSGYNVLSTISKSEFNKGDSMETVRDDINNNRTGQVGFIQDGMSYYMVYTSINPDDWYLLTFVPTKAVNEKSDMLLGTTLILCGLITLIFAGLVALLVYTFYRNKKKLEQIAYVDSITGGNTIQKFYDLAESALNETDHPKYVLVYSNMQKFKVLNEQFGQDVCNTILSAFYRNVNSDLTGNECLGRVSADNFCMLLEYKDETSLLARFERWHADADKFMVTNKPVWSLPVTEFGVYVIDENTISFPLMTDRAKLALKDFSQTINNKLRYAIYNDTVHHKLFREKQLEDMMETSLKNNEFQVFLQPKYHLPERTIKGAEALTRWISKSDGMIFPDEFIPLFEKNGFIVQLDLWIFEKVCQKIRSWLDAGLVPVKISVNCSKIQLRDSNFLTAYQEIVSKYNVPPKYIEIELTESVVMEDVQRLAKIIDDIHAIGFGCSMDDFGSGYSSLNLIQSIPVDTLKLDKIFFRTENDSSRLESVVGSIITMAKALSMAIVSEGVEHQEQVEMLERIGCDFVQGYVFAKPMPISQFEELLFDQKSKDNES